MKRTTILCIGVVLGLACLAGLPHEFFSVSATDTNTTTTFAANNIRTISIKNNGPSTVYVEHDTGVATTSHQTLKVGDRLNVSMTQTPRPARFRGPVFEAIGLICASGETATVEITGYPLP